MHVAVVKRHWAVCQILVSECRGWLTTISLLVDVYPEGNTTMMGGRTKYVKISQQARIRAARVEDGCQENQKEMQDSRAAC